MTARPRNRRRVEIYFILYLAALVLLLPDATDRSSPEGAAGDVVRLDLQPERLRLLCRFVRDTTGTYLVTAMDTVNTIRYFGSVGDVTVSAVVEDETSGARTQIDEGDRGGIFSLVHDRERALVRFVWNPTRLEPSSRTFRVMLTGTGAPLAAVGPNGGDGTVGRASARVTGATEFVLTTTVDERPAGSDAVRIDSRIDTVFLPQPAADPAAGSGASDRGEFWIGPARDRVVELVGRRWANRLSVGGADVTRDLTSLPVARASGPDNRAASSVSVRFDDRARSVIVEGMAPSVGSLTVDVSARRTDGTLRTTRFVVDGLPLADVDIPTALYPGVEYTIATRLPQLADAEVRAVVRDGNQWRVQPTTASQIRFTPQVADTGRALYFERYVNEQKVSSEALRVRNFDAPEIMEVSRMSDGDRRRVTVRFFGAKDNRPSLDVLDGNARARKLYGFLRKANPDEEPSISWIEVFEIEPKDPAKPLTYRIQAVDRRGARSRILTQAE